MSFRGYQEIPENYRTSLRQFCNWLDEQGVQTLNSLDSELVQRYEEYRLSNVRVITAYADQNRPDVEDEHGRKPLLSSKDGRVVETTVQRYVYTATRPCIHNGKNCPFDRELDA